MKTEELKTEIQDITEQTRTSHGTFATSLKI